MIKRKIFGITLIFLFAQTFSLHAGNPIDSLKQLLFTDREDTNRVIHLNNLSREYEKISSYDTATYIGNAALHLALKLKYPKGLANAYNNTGIIYFDQGNFEKALEKFFASMKIREEMGDRQGIASSYNNIGVVYYFQANQSRERGDSTKANMSYKKAVDNYFTALKLIRHTGQETHDEKKLAADAYNGIGSAYFDQCSYEKALEIFFASLKIRKEINDKSGIVASYNNIASAYEKLSKSDKALEYYFASLKISTEIDNKRETGNTCVNIAWIYLAKLNYTEAAGWFQKGLQLAKKIRAKHLLIEAYKGLADMSEKMNDWQNAYKYRKLYYQNKDSVFSVESNKLMIEMQTKYETEKKEHKISELEKEQQIQTLTIDSINEKKKNQLIIFICALFFVVISAMIFYSRYKIKQREQLKTEQLKEQELRTQAIIEAQEQERTRIARDLHDGIGQTLAGVIANFEQFNKEVISLSEEKQKIFATTASSLDEAYKELRRCSHEMMPGVLKEVGLSAAISDLLDRTLSSTQIAYNFDTHQVENIDKSIAIGVYRIFQELLSNILKHAQAGNISVQLFCRQDHLIMIVEDDGVGIKDTGKKSGIGFMNMAGRAQAMHGTFLINPGPVRGTVANIRIPLYSTTDKYSI